MPDPRIPEDTIMRTAELANAVEDMREAAAQEAKDLWSDFREELKSLGLKGSEVSAEVSQFKAAVAEKRMNSEDRAKADAKSEGKDGYLAIINSPRARARTRGSEPLLTKAAGQAVTAQEPVVASSVESEAAEISTPIQPETANETSDETGHVAADAAGHGQVEADAETQPTGGENVATASAHIGTGEGAHNASVTTFIPKPLRPYCLNPGTKCGGQAKRHCWSCQKAHDDKQGVA